MLSFDVKRKINTLRDILVGKVPDPKAQVEQITIALIYKFMDDMDLESVEFGGSREFFKDGPEEDHKYEKYAYSQIMLPENSAQQRLNLYSEGIIKMSENPYLPQLFRDIFRGAFLPYRDPETLNMFLKEIGAFTYSDSEDLGNAFEYLLSIMGSQGDAGQFRTPRHIIDMMVEIIAPKKNESVLDPACGTAGFLISAFKYIDTHNRDAKGVSTLTADDRNRITTNFVGYDISPDMVRLSRVNMYLHRFTKPHISEYDTLTSLDKWDDTYDIILANPPFMTPKGGIIPHNRYRVQAKRSEVLFVDYIAEHLSPIGRAAVIVPEGIVFQLANAYRNLRKYLVDDGLLYAVISLPAGVFNPYSGVKTSILLMDKTLAKTRDDILFVKLNNDGFDLGAQRREIKRNDIPDVINVVKDYIAGKDVSANPLATVVKKSAIMEKDFTLVGERYKETAVLRSKWPLVKLGEVCEIRVGSTPSKQNPLYWENGNIKWISSKYISDDGHVVDYDLITPLAVSESSTKIAPKDSTILVSRVSVGKSAFLTDDYAINQDITCLIPNEKILPKYLFSLAKILARRIEENAQGIGVRGVTQSFIAGLYIPLPPLSVQEEIVAEIESYQKIIDGAKQVVDNYKPIIKIDPEWEMINIGEMYDISYGLTISIPQNEDEDGIKIVSTAEVRLDGSLDLSKIRRVKYESNYERFILEPNTLLFNWRNAPNHVGKTAFFKETDDKYISASFLLTMKNKHPDRFDNEYIWCAINNLRETGYFMRNARQAVNQANFNRDQLSKTQLAIPSINIQCKIAARIKEELSIVEQNKRLIEIYKQKIKDKISEVWGE